VVESGLLLISKVSRIKATSPSSDLSLILDINSELYPLQKDEVISLNLSSSLRLDGKEDKGWRDLQRGERTLADDYDYVCYGKVYRFDEGIKGSDRVYVSFYLILFSYAEHFD
jgi:DNA-directed RNA polymerases I, II, and III subunit RPABC3